MAEISPELKTQGSRAFWVIVVVMLGVWFYNEALTTKRTLREESSLMFSNLSTQFKNIYLTNVSKSENVDKEFLENENRFQSEVTRLIDSFEDSPYSNLGVLLSRAHSLSKNSVNKNLDISENSKIPELNLIEKEISSLLKARSLVNSSDNSAKDEGKKMLLDLVKNSSLVNADAAISYFMSLKNNPEEKLSGVTAVQELVRNKPEFKEDIEQELSRFGIYIPLV